MSKRFEFIQGKTQIQKNKGAVIRGSVDFFPVEFFVDFSDKFEIVMERMDELSDFDDRILFPPNHDLNIFNFDFYFSPQQVEDVRTRLVDGIGYREKDVLGSLRWENLLPIFFGL